MLVCAIILGIVTPTGTLYMTAAVLTGSVYLAVAWQLMRRPERVLARKLFLLSLLVLPLLLSALMTDLILRA
jgi:heme O synthase-like polyprenyltransferase